MAKSKEFRKSFLMIAILLLLIGIFIINRAIVNNDINTKVQETKINLHNRFANRKLDTDVLKEKKFQELKPIPKLDRNGVEISEDELKHIRRRNSNPFKPF